MVRFKYSLISSVVSAGHWVDPLVLEHAGCDEGGAWLSRGAAVVPVGWSWGAERPVAGTEVILLLLVDSGPGLGSLGC